MTTQERFRLPHKDGEVLFVTGRSQLADENRMPQVLRMKHTVKSSDLGGPTIEGLYQMYHDPHSRPIIKKQAAGLIIKPNANPDDPQHMAAANVGMSDEPQRSQSPGSTSMAPTEEINSKFEGASGRTALRRSMDTFNAKGSSDVYDPGRRSERPGSSA